MRQKFLEKNLKCCLILFVESVRKSDVLNSLFHILWRVFKFLKLFIESIEEFFFGKISKMAHNILDFDTNACESRFRNIGYNFVLRNEGKCSKYLEIELNFIDKTDIIDKETFNIINGLSIDVEIDVFELLMNVREIHIFIASNFK